MFRSPTFILQAFATLSLLTVVGCGTRNAGVTTGAIAGTAIGAGAGAAIGNQSGNAGTGAAIGGATGAVVGAVVGSELDKPSSETKVEDAMIAKQKKLIAEQQRELDDLRRQKFHDDYFRDRYGDSLEQ
jgi:uncharacterized membrane protein